jgi:hypothetical protein
MGFKASQVREALSIYPKDIEEASLYLINSYSATNALEREAEEAQKQEKDKEENAEEEGKTEEQKRKEEEEGKEKEKEAVEDASRKEEDEEQKKKREQEEAEEQERKEEEEAKEEEDLRVVIVTLEEAEGLRYIIQQNMFPELQIFLCTPSGEFLTRAGEEEEIPSDRESTSTGSLSSLLELSRFFNNEFNYNNEQAISLLSLLSRSTSTSARKQFFEAVLAARPRRSYREWKATPVVTIFEHQNEETLRRQKELTDKLRGLLLELIEGSNKKFKDQEELMTYFKKHGDEKFIDISGLQNSLSELNVPFNASEIAAVISSITTGKSFVSYAVFFAQLFGEDNLTASQKGTLEKGEEQKEGAEGIIRRQIANLAFVAHHKALSEGSPHVSEKSEPKEKRGEGKGKVEEGDEVDGGNVHRVGKLVLASGRSLAILPENFITSELQGQPEKGEDDDEGEVGVKEEAGWSMVVPREVRCHEGKWYFEVRVLQGEVNFI